MGLNRYEFNAKKHLHTLDGKPLTGVTTVLSVIAKPALISWAANKAVDYIFENKTAGGDFTVVVPMKILEEARKAHIVIKEKAGNWGTAIHKWIESYVQQKIFGADVALFPTETVQVESIDNFKKWADDNKVKFLESEKNLYSEKYWIGGICDLIAEIDGKKWVVDIKTGSDVYPEHFWQLAAYQLMLEEMGLYSNFAGHIVLNLKKNGEFQEKRSVSNEENKEAFLACLKIYRTREKLNNQII